MIERSIAREYHMCRGTMDSSKYDCKHLQDRIVGIISQESVKANSYESQDEFSGFKSECKV
jgi:hypothetical protein